jgi:hypothetical protein
MMMIGSISDNESSLLAKPRRIRRSLGVLGMGCLVLLLNGCAAFTPSRGLNPYRYDQYDLYDLNSGYPTSGGPNGGN